MTGANRLRASQLVFLCVCATNAVLMIVLGCLAWRIACSKKAPPEYSRHNLTRIVRASYAGRSTDTIDLLGRYTGPRLGHLAETLLLSRSDLGAGGIWAITLANHRIRHLTSNLSRSAFAVPSPNPTQLLFSSWDRTYAELSLRDEDGSVTPLLEEKSSNMAADWSSDGRWIAFTRTDPNGTKVYLLQMLAHRTCPLTLSASMSYEARFSPDSKWIAFTSNASGRDEVYIAPVPSTLPELPLANDRAIRISQHGGFSPEWSKAGELLFISAQMNLMRVNWHDEGGNREIPRCVFPLSTLNVNDYEYLYGGYCVDRAKDQLLFVLNKHVQ